MKAYKGLNRKGYKTAVKRIAEFGYVSIMAFMDFEAPGKYYAPFGRHRIEGHNKHERKLLKRIEQSKPFKIRAGQPCPIKFSDY